MSNGSSTNGTALAPVVLRLALAAIFIYHGYEKVSDERNSWGASWAINFWERQAAPPPEALAKLQALAEKKADRKESKADEASVMQAKDWLAMAYSESRSPTPETVNIHGVQLAVAWGELAGGVALLLGALTRVAAAGLLLIQVGAIYTVTAVRGFYAAEGGYEYNLALIAMCLSLFLSGSGAYALDAVRRRRMAATHPTTHSHETVGAAPLR